MLFSRDTALTTVAWSTWTYLLTDPGSSLTRTALAAGAALAGIAALHGLRLAVLIWLPPHRALTLAAGACAVAVDAVALRLAVPDSGLGALHFAVGLAASSTVGAGLQRRRLTVTEVKADNDRLRRAAAERIADHQAAASAVLVDIEALIQTEVAGYEGRTARTTMSQLRRVPADVMRPITHEIRAELLHWIPEVPQAQLAHHPVRITSVDAQRPAVLAAGAALVALVAQPSAVVLASLLTLVSSVLVRRILNALPHTFTSTTVATLGLVVATVPAGLAFHDIALLLTGTTPVIGIATTLARSIEAEHAADEDALVRNNAQLEWTMARLGVIDWFQRSEATRALHGPMQTIVTSAVPRIEAAISAGEPTFATVGELQRRIVHSLGPLVNPRAEALDLERELGDIVETWSGVAEVVYLMDSDILPPLSTDPACAMAVVDIVSVACDEAVRDNGATKIFVTLAHTPGTTFVSVSENGTVRNPLDQGIGVRLLDSCSLAWFRKHTFGRNLMNASLPYLPDTEAAWAITSA